MAVSQHISIYRPLYQRNHRFPPAPTFTQYFHCFVNTTYFCVTVQLLWFITRFPAIFTSKYMRYNHVNHWFFVRLCDLAVPAISSLIYVLIEKSGVAVAKFSNIMFSLSTALNLNRPPIFSFKYLVALRWRHRRLKIIVRSPVWIV